MGPLRAFSVSLPEELPLPPGDEPMTVEIMPENRATPPRLVLPVCVREKLFSFVLHYRSLRRVCIVLRLPESTVRRSLVGRSLSVGQFRSVREALMSGRARYARRSATDPIARGAA